MTTTGMMMMTTSTTTTMSEVLTEDDLAVLLYLHDQSSLSASSIHLQQLHRDIEEQYGWLSVDIKYSIKRLITRGLVAPNGNKDSLIVTTLGAAVSQRISG